MPGDNSLRSPNIVVRDSLNNNYSRRSAVKYTLDYALNPNPSYRYFKIFGDGGGDCTNFVSQCLRAGGAPISLGAKWPWWYNSNGSSNVNKHTWSLSWSVAGSLYWCLKSRGKLSMKGLKGIEVEDMDMLELGDVIQYEKGSGKIYHSAIITSFTIDGGMRVPLISQHSYDLLNVTHIKPAANKMHFMKIII